MKSHITASADECLPDSSLSETRACALRFRIVAAAADDIALRPHSRRFLSTRDEVRIGLESLIDPRFPERPNLQENGRCHNANAVGSGMPAGAEILETDRAGMVPARRSNPPPVVEAPAATMALPRRDHKSPCPTR